MKKSYKIIWGLLTPAPIVMIAAGVLCFLFAILKNLPEKGVTAAPQMPEQLIGGLLIFYGLLLLGIFLGFFIHISYFIHLIRKDDMNKDMKTLWVVLFLVLNIIANIVYWFMVVLPEPESTSQPEIPEDVPVKRTRKKK